MLVFYMYAEGAQAAENARVFFKSADGVSVVFVNCTPSRGCSLTLPPSVTVVNMPRDSPSDLAALPLAAADARVTPLLAKATSILLLNSTAVGPFVPPLIKTPWWALIEEALREVALWGPVIETPPDQIGAEWCPGPGNVPFIHSWCLGIQPAHFKTVLAMCPPFASDKYAALKSERAITAVFLREGYKIDCAMARYRGVDWRDRTLWDWRLHSPTTVTCPEVPGNYEGADLDPFETMYFKRSRPPHAFRGVEVSGLAPHVEKQVERLVAWALK
jgi:hypothetical protein